MQPGVHQRVGKHGKLTKSQTVAKKLGKRETEGDSKQSKKKKEQDEEKELEKQKELEKGVTVKPKCQPVAERQKYPREDLKLNKVLPENLNLYSEIVPETIPLSALGDLFMIWEFGNTFK